jgi:hypothetical protein
MQGRVDFSRVNIQYQSGARSGGGFLSPIRQAFGSIGSILGFVIATIIVLLPVAVPLGLVLWALWAGVRRLRQTAARRRTTGEAEVVADPKVS